MHSIENRAIPRIVGLQMMKMTTMSIPTGIDGVKRLPRNEAKPIVDLRDRVIDASEITKGMERSWFRSSKGWTL